MSFSYNRVYYKSVLGSSVGARGSFDGSVPYCVSCSSVFSKSAGDEGSVSDYFSVIGQANTGVDVSSAHAGLIKQCGVNLTDIHCVLVGEGLYTVRVTVCDPSSFPSSTDHVYLYENCVQLVGSNSVLDVKIPDISGLVINGTSEQPLNVCVFVSSFGSTLRNLSFHCVASVDD